MKNNKPTKSITIIGPTSSGKSEVAIWLAKKYNGEIISADSRQIYRHLDLGTGKVTGQWLDCSVSQIEACQDKDYNVFVSSGVAHHLIDFVDLKDDYNVSHFKKDCQRLIADIHDRGKMPILCGGTGFWIASVVDNLELPQVAPNAELRKELDNKTLDELFEQLKQIDPLRAMKIDQKNKVRLVRAIEIAQALGQVPQINIYPKKSNLLTNTLSKIKNQFNNPTSKLQSPTSNFLQIGIDHPKEILDQRIKKRLDDRFKSGMIDEVRFLHDQLSLSWEEIQAFGLAYYWIPQFLQNQISETEMKDRTFLAERNYAKRQRTWFKRDKRILWERNYAKIERLITDFQK